MTGTGSCDRLCTAVVVNVYSPGRRLRVSGRGSKHGLGLYLVTVVIGRRDRRFANQVTCNLPIRPPLKIIVFPVHRPGELIRAEWIHFFHISEIIFFSQHFPHHFYTEKKIYLKKKRFCGLPTGYN